MRRIRSGLAVALLLVAAAGGCRSDALSAGDDADTDCRWIAGTLFCRG